MPASLIAFCGSFNALKRKQRAQIKREHLDTLEPCCCGQAVVPFNRAYLLDRMGDAITPR